MIQKKRKKQLLKTVLKEVTHGEYLHELQGILTVLLHVAMLVYIGDPSLNVKANKLVLTRATMKAGRRSLLALNLLDILFDQDILRQSTVCGSRDSSKKSLDLAKIEAIRSYVIRALCLTAVCIVISVIELQATVLRSFRCKLERMRKRLGRKCQNPLRTNAF